MTGRQHYSEGLAPSVTNQQTLGRKMEISNQGTKHRSYADQYSLFIKQSYMYQLIVAVPPSKPALLNKNGRRSMLLGLLSTTQK